MLKPTEKAKIATELERLFKTYQSSRTIEPEAVVYYVEDCAEFSAEAVGEAIVRFRKGLVPERSAAFAPSVAEFVSEVRDRQTAIDVREFWNKTDFLLVGSPEWKALCEMREIPSMPAIEYKGPNEEFRGKIGWYVDKSQMKSAAPLIAKYRKEAARIAARGPLRLPVPKVQGIE